MMKRGIGFDHLGVMLGGVLKNLLITDSSQHILGVTGISSVFTNAAQKYKVSPYGYVYNEDNLLVGKTLSLAPAYEEDGKIFGYLNVNGSFDRADVEDNFF